jgi:hypothetical protein
MTELKLAKIPDRKPVKLSINVTPHLHALLTDYADLYRENYGQSESIADLIPYILQSFLDSDRVFAKSRTTGLARK